MKTCFVWVLTILLALPILAACNGVFAQPETAAEVDHPMTEVGEVAPRVPAAQAAEKYGLISGSIEDRGFNQLAWQGLQRAEAELGVEIEYLETDAGNAVDNIAQLLDEGVSGIVTVGFALSQLTRDASRANLDVPFISVDIPSQTPGDLGLLFSTDEPAFMAGYLAAGMTETGTVCTYGGQRTPPVLIFMVGFPITTSKMAQTSSSWAGIPPPLWVRAVRGRLPAPLPSQRKALRSLKNFSTRAAISSFP
jgi:basic membrane lipoprotein Med (substrate-binding protein (PBP1-ABC) superfamily)